MPRKTKPGQRVWVRCGDQDDYSSYDSLAEAAEYLVQMGVRRKVTRINAGGPFYGKGLTGCLSFSDRANYCGNNYISIYWGGSKADDVDRGLFIREWHELNRHLAHKINEVKGTTTADRRMGRY